MKKHTEVFGAKKENLTEILNRMDSVLSDFGVEEAKRSKARFRMEDVLVSLLRESPDGSTVKMTVKEFFKSVTVRFACNGNEFDYSEDLKELFPGDFDEEFEAIIRENLLKEYEKDVRVSHKNNMNIVTMTVVKRKKKPIIVSVAAMLLGILCGIIFKNALTDDASKFMADSVFGMGTSLFLRAIKMIIAFLVFFSIASSIAGFRDLKELGRLFARVLVLFAITSVLTILITYGICQVMPIGDASMRSLVDSSASIDTMKGVSSVFDLIAGIIPENFLGAFIESNMLQILFIAILTGIAVSMMGKNSTKVSDALSIADELFQKITLLIVKLMPVCIFCSMASMVIKIDPTQIHRVISWLGQICLCDGLVILMLLLMILVFGRTSPLWFLKQFGQVMMSSFAMASSNAVMPMTMQTCKERLGISPKIYTFSVPLGIVINMDGGCVTMLVSVFFLARVYGIEISIGMLFSLFITVFLLSVAAPAVPGGILLCLTVLLPNIGIPIEGISIFIGLYFLVAMVQTMTNVTSTVACSYVAYRMDWARA